MPYLGVPIYMIFTIGFYLSSSRHTFTYLISTLLGWLFYLFAVRYYTHEILSSLYNYWMEAVLENLEEFRRNKQSQDKDETQPEIEEEDETNSFDDTEFPLLASNKTAASLGKERQYDRWVFI